MNQFKQHFPFSKRRQVSKMPSGCASGIFGPQRLASSQKKMHNRKKPPQKNGRSFFPFQPIPRISKHYLLQTNPKLFHTRFSLSTIITAQRLLKRQTGWMQTKTWSRSAFSSCASSSSLQKIKTPISNKSKLGIYVHWPYCSKICPYCDFNKYLNSDPEIAGSLLQSMQQQIGLFAESPSLLTGQNEPHQALSKLSHNTPPPTATNSNSSNYFVTSIYFGGGTPSLLTAKQLEQIIASIKSKFQTDPQCEITVEANPTDAETKKFQEFRDVGVNRLSLGIQSLCDKSLRFLGRNHSAVQAARSIQTAQTIFPNTTFDLIYGLPSQIQTFAEWKSQLDSCLTDLKPSHLSLYSLTIEPKTPLFRRVQKGDFLPLDEDDAAEYFEFNVALMKKHGYLHYEISNFAQPGHFGKHNLGYWTGEDYLGIGPGASSRLFNATSQTRLCLKQKLNPKKWVDEMIRVGKSVLEEELLSEKDNIKEILILGLRKRDALSSSTFQKHAQGKSFEAVFDANKLKNLEELDLLRVTPDKIQVTEKGSQVLNYVQRELFDALDSKIK